MGEPKHSAGRCGRGGMDGLLGISGSQPISMRIGWRALRRRNARHSALLGYVACALPTAKQPRYGARLYASPRRNQPSHEFDECKAAYGCYPHVRLKRELSLSMPSLGIPQDCRAGVGFFLPRIAPAPPRPKPSPIRSSTCLKNESDQSERVVDRLCDRVFPDEMGFGRTAIPAVETSSACLAGRHRPALRRRNALTRSRTRWKRRAFRIGSEPQSRESARSAGLRLRINGDSTLTVLVWRNRAHTRWRAFLQEATGQTTSRTIRR